MKTEGRGVASFEGEDNIAKLERFIEAAMAGYQAEGIPVGANGRLDENLYRNLYGEREVKNDLATNHNYETFFGDISGGEMPADRRLHEGEQLEMLSHSIFIKNLGEKFVVVRASFHDDRKNKVDTLLLDRQTGNLVCAFDEIGDISGVDYERKLSKVQTKNIHEGGASLKYGIKLETNGGKIIPSPAENIPLFYIALPSEFIKKGMEEFLPDMENQSDFERKLFGYFVATIAAQIEGLELYDRRLDPALKQKLAAFKQVMEPLKSKIKP